MAKGVFLRCGRKFSKALCLDTPVLTKYGFKRNGDIVPGDVVFDEKGNAQTVLEAHDVIKDAESYRVWFKNGEYIDACKDHKWFTSSKLDRKSFRRFPKEGRAGSVKNTLEIFNSVMHGKEYNHKIPICDPIDFEEKDLPLDPYLLGLWLGDGNTYRAGFTTSDTELLRYFEAEGFGVSHYDGYDYGITGGFEKKLKELNLIRNKHIPAQYLLSSKAQRANLLRGLMDSDGTINSRGNNAYYCTVLPDLAHQVHYLISSLGLKASTKSYKSFIGKKQYKDAYHVGFTPTFNCFRLQRKAKRIKITGVKDNSHTIVKVEKIQDKDMRCLTVTGDSSLYLVSNSCIPTHNTEVAIVFGHLICMIFPGSHGYYIADTMKHAGELVWHNRRLPDFFTKLMRYPGESVNDYSKRLQRGQALEKKWVLKKNNSDMRKYFVNGSWFKVDGADNYSNADGMNPHFIIYDEFKHHDPRFHEAMEPNLTTNKAPILIVGTPPEGTKSYYTKIEKDFQMSKGFRTFCMPSYYNTYIYPGGKNDPDFLALKKRYEDRGDSDVFEREYLAKYVKGGSKAIFPVFDGPDYDETGDKIIKYSRHVRPHNEILAKLEVGPKDWDYYVAYDAGTVTCFAACFAAVNSVTRECLILDEIYETTQSETTSRKIYNRANAIKKQYSHADDWYEVYDNAAAWFANDVHSEFEDASLIPCTKDYNKKEDRLSMIKDMMIFDYFKMSENASKGRWEIENYYIDDKGRIPKEDDHFIDCLRYMLNAANYDTVPQILFVESSRRSYTYYDDMQETQDEYESLIGDLYED